MSSKLNQIIAVEKGVKSRAISKFSDLYHVLQKPEQFTGFSKKYQSKDEEGEKLNPERKKVQFTVPDIIDSGYSVISDLINLTYRKDIANMKATANVVVDGDIVVANAPVTFLLFLEKQLVDVETFIETLPVLDPTEEWEFDEEAQFYKTEPIVTNRTKKVPKVVVLYNATDKHPAQTELLQEDVIVGEWENIKHSGAIPKHKQEELLQRVRKLMIAVKNAREEANEYEETESPKAIGEQIFSYLTL